EIVPGPARQLPGLLELPGRRGALVVLRSLQLKGLAAACQDDPGNLVAEAVRWQLARQVCQLALLRLVKHVCRHGQAADLAAGFAANIDDVLILAAERQFDRRLLILKPGLRIRILFFLLCLRSLAVFLFILILGVFLAVSGVGVFLLILGVTFFLLVLLFAL